MAKYISNILMISVLAMLSGLVVFFVALLISASVHGLGSPGHMPATPVSRRGSVNVAESEPSSDRGAKTSGERQD